MFSYAQLAIRSLKDTPRLLPVRFAKMGTDGSGRREGWVSSAFNSMIVGFGELGQEALGFVYEFGAFVGQDFRKSPFSCTVLDKRMDAIAPGFRKRFPGLTEAAGIRFLQCETGTDSYRDALKQLLPGLNYVMVCLGDDDLNLSVARELAECAAGHGVREDFVILVARKSSPLPEVADCIRAFGREDTVMSPDNVSGAAATARARAFHAGYMRAQGSAEDPAAVWDARDARIASATDPAVRSKLLRQRYQDYSNAYNIPVKLALMGPEVTGRAAEVAESIPATYAGTHYTGSDPHVAKVLRYISVQEHLRWEASHAALGYAPGERTDEILKTHACIRDYDDLSPEMQHYDYLVIKTTLALQG